MVRRSNTSVDPVSDQPAELDTVPAREYEDEALTLGDQRGEVDTSGQPSHLPAFMLGTVVGALALEWLVASFSRRRRRRWNQLYHRRTGRKP